VRELILDDSLPRGLAAELAARGRPARTLGDLGLTGATDREVLAATAEDVLVTTAELHGPGAVAVVIGRTPEARRDAVHRFAHRMSVQRPGSVVRYPR
jgi:predicted nuclease of predicted toxin-antitoxin system